MELLIKSKILQISRKLRNKLSSLLLIIVAINFNNAFAQEASKKLVAITQIAQHPSLDQARNAIIDELKANGYELGKNLEILEQNAQGNITNAVAIARHFVSANPDAIVAISTPSAQAAVNAAKGSGVPVVFSSVTDPVAAGLVQDLKEPAEYITGAIDFPLIVEELELITKFAPAAKTIGFIYSAGEANSLKTISLMKEAMAGKYEYAESVVLNSAQVGQAVSALAGKVDAIYIPSDNVVFSALTTLVQISREQKIPVFSSDPDSVKHGVLACIGYTQYAVGQQAGRLLVKILSGEKLLEISAPEKAEIWVNKSSAGILGLEVPAEIMKKNVQFVE